jgi:hypothetical protein
VLRALSKVLSRVVPVVLCSLYIVSLCAVVTARSDAEVLVFTLSALALLALTVLYTLYKCGAESCNL